MKFKIAAVLIAFGILAVAGCKTIDADNAQSVSYPEYNHWWR